jgi:hypothetical protein
MVRRTLNRNVYLITNKIHPTKAWGVCYTYNYNIVMFIFRAYDFKAVLSASSYGFATDIPAVDWFTLRQYEANVNFISLVKALPDITILSATWSAVGDFQFKIEHIE